MTLSEVGAVPGAEPSPRGSAPLWGCVWAPVGPAAPASGDAQQVALPDARHAREARLRAHGLSASRGGVDTTSARSGGKQSVSAKERSDIRLLAARA